MRLEDSFRELRRAWFNRVLRFNAHEREWEDEDREKMREDNNRLMQQQYDTDTEAIIAGEDRPLTPGCWNDLTSR